MKRKIIVRGILIAAILLVFVFLLKNNKQMQGVSLSEIIIRDVSLSEQKFTLSGSFVSSGKSFRNYTYTIDGDSLYIVINGGLVTKEYPSGDFSIKIEDEKLKNVSKVFLKHGKVNDHIIIK